MADDMIPHMARAVITQEFEVWVVIDDLGFIGRSVEMGLIDVGTDEINPAVVFRLETEAPQADRHRNHLGELWVFECEIELLGKPEER